MLQKPAPEPPVAVARRSDGVAGRLLKGGGANLVASAAAALTPLLGVHALTSDEYAIWTLLAVAATAMLVLEWGSTTLATRASAQGGLSRDNEIRLGAVATVGPVVLALIVALCWKPYSDAADLRGFETSTVLLSVVVMTAGCVLRAYANVVSAALLGARQFARRSQILIVGALSQFAVTLVALNVGAGLYALAYGYLASGAIQIVLVSRFRSGLRPKAGVAHYLLDGREIRTYVFSKGSVTILGLAVTQMDRWVLGALLDPEQLRSYDVAARLAMMPKVALIAICSGLIAEASNKDTVLPHLYRRALLIVSVLSLCGAAGVSVIMAFGGARSGQITATYIAVAAAVIGAHAINAMTIPAVMMLGGIGRPQLELTYTIPLFAAVMAAYGIGLASGDGMLTIGIWATAMILTSAVFAFYSKKWMVRLED